MTVPERYPIARPMPEGLWVVRIESLRYVGGGQSHAWLVIDDNFTAHSGEYKTEDAALKRAEKQASILRWDRQAMLLKIKYAQCVCTLDGQPAYASAARDSALATICLAGDTWGPLQCNWQCVEHCMEKHGGRFGMKAGSFLPYADECKHKEELP